MHQRVSVSAMCTATWDLDRDLAFYAESGITNVGMSLRKLESAGLEAGTAKIVEAGLRVTNLLGLGFSLTEADKWPDHQERLCRAVGAAAAMGAESLVLTTGSAGSMTWEDAAGALQDAIGPILVAAAQAGVQLALEHTNSLRVDVSFVHTLRDAVDLARQLEVGVCMECNACWAERGIGATIDLGLDRIRLVQVSDFVIGTLATPDRAVPGDGDVPLARLVAQLLASGYDGVFDLELIGPRIEAEGYPSAVGRAVRAMTELLEVASV